MKDDERQELRELLETRLSGIDQRLAQTSAESGQLKTQVEQIGTRLDRVETRLEQVDARFDQMDARFEQVDARFEQTDARIESRFDEALRIGDQHARETRDFILAQSADVKRHFDMVADRVEVELKKVAEGYGVLTERVDGLCRERQGQGRGLEGRGN